MKNVLIVSLLMLSFQGLIAQNTLTIKGNVVGDLEGYNKLTLRNNDAKTDTLLIDKNGHFEITYPFTGRFDRALTDDYNQKKFGWSYDIVIISDSPGVIEIKDIDIHKGVTSGTITGIEAAAAYKDFQALCREAYIEASTELQNEKGSNNAFYSRNGQNTPEVEAYLKKYEALTKQKIQAIIESFITSRPNSFASLYALRIYGSQALSADDLDKNFKRLSKTLQQTETGKELLGYVAGLKASGQGKEFKNFTLKDPKGKSVSLNKLKGKYVLIDFWASWCVPCIQSFPELKKIYEKYKGEKFEIYSISIDKNKEAWLKAVAKYNLPWLQTLDEKQVSTSTFAINAVPTLYLIDPEGKIVMTAAGFEENGAIEKKLAEVFNK